MNVARIQSLGLTGVDIATSDLILTSNNGAEYTVSFYMSITNGSAHNSSAMQIFWIDESGSLKSFVFPSFFWDTDTYSQGSVYIRVKAGKTVQAQLTSAPTGGATWDVYVSADKVQPSAFLDEGQ